mmetsp:Transcript_12841/g.24198  ORF Transcript_12841/g.24198 Transcript_12841/m.24198 type:complete len:308 (+) Transcript_12841:124-1047(+)
MRFSQLVACSICSWAALAAVSAPAERMAEQSSPSDTCSTSVEQSPASALAQVRRTRDSSMSKLPSEDAEQPAFSLIDSAVKAVTESVTSTDSSSMGTLGYAVNLLGGSLLTPLHAAFVWGSLGASAVMHSIWSMKKVKDAQWEAAGNADPIVRKHNYYRCLHGVPHLLWDGELADNAQEWADTASAAKLHHSPLEKRMDVGGWRYVGENLAQVERPEEAVDLWYSEIAHTDNSTGKVEKFSSDTGHFTQVVWKESEKIGCGTNKHLVVCQYGTGGNVAGRYTSNVLNLMLTDEDCKDILEKKRKIFD